MDDKFRTYLLKQINLHLDFFSKNELINLKLINDKNKIKLKYNNLKIKIKKEIKKEMNIKKLDNRKRYYNPITKKHVLCKKSIDKQLDNYLESEQIAELFDKL